jgi:hypothetical protein
LGQPAILVENILSGMQFPLHVLSATEQGAGFEVYHLANARRSLVDRWQGVTPNLLQNIRVACDRLRYVNGLALDRGHNLAGKTCTLLGSNDGWVTAFTLWTGTIPSVAVPASLLDNAPGAVTEEGAFVARFPGQAFMAYEFQVAAVAAFVPQIVGLWVGLWYQPEFFMPPWGEDQAEIIATETQSPYGWTGSTLPVSRRTGELVMRLRDWASYDLARYHLAGHFLACRRAAWIVLDDGQAERAVLALRQPGTQGFQFESGWGFRQARVAWREHEPRLPGG